MAGRPTKLTKELIAQADKYLGQIDKNTEIPTVEGFAMFLNLHRDTVYDWVKQDSPLAKQFSDIFKEVQQAQAAIVINGAIFGHLNPVISKLLLVKHDYIDRRDSDVTTNGNDITFVNDVPRPGKPDADDR